MRILVTGGAGQVGTDLIRMLSARGADVVVFDLFPRPDQLPDHVEWIRGDVTNAPELFDCVQGVQPDVLYHFAAILSASGERMPHRCYSVNQHGTHHALEAARLFGVKQVMFASTIAVFGPDLPEPVPNEVPLQPTTMYGVTKVAGELLCDYYFQRFGVDVRGVRYPGIISSETPPGGGTTDYAVEIFYEAIKHQKYTCFLREDSVLPMMYMPDCIKGTIDLMEADLSRLRHHADFNLAAMSFGPAELVAEIKKHIPGFTCEYEPDFRQAIADSWPRTIDDSAAREEWGWEPEYDLAAMTADMLERLGRKYEEGRL